MKIRFLSLVALCAALGLQGCVSSGSPNTLQPGRTTAVINADSALVDTVRTNLESEQGFATTHIKADAFNGYLLLTGQVPLPGMVKRAEEIARKAKGIRGLYNGITVGDNTSTWRHINDSIITARVNRGIEGSPLASLSRVQVVTENGVVFLLGAVQRYEADGLARIAAQVSGVNGVIKVFEYVD